MSDTDENMLFLGNGDGSFRKEKNSDVSASAETSRTAIMMDINGDGLSDMYTSNCCERPQHLFSFRYCKDGEASPPLKWHHRPGYDCPRDGNQVSVSGHTHGHDRTSEFASRAEAEAACSMGCFGIYDDGCDDSGPWRLCTAPASRWNRTVDAQAGCAFELKRPRQCYKCPSWATPNTMRLSANFVRQAELAHQVSQASVMASLSTAFNASQESSETSQTLSMNVENALLDCTQKVDQADAMNAVTPLCLTRGKLVGNSRPAVSHVPPGWGHRTGRAAKQAVWNVQGIRSLPSALARCALDGPVKIILLALTAR